MVCSADLSTADRDSLEISAQKPVSKAALPMFGSFDHCAGLERDFCREFDLEALALTAVHEGVVEARDRGADRFAEARAQHVEGLVAMKKIGGAHHVIPDGASVGKAVGQALDD